MTPSSHREVIGNHDNQINLEENMLILVVGIFSLIAQDHYTKFGDSLEYECWMYILS